MDKKTNRLLFPGGGFRNSMTGELKGLVIHGWDLLRKPTTPVHLVYGAVCAFFCYQFGFFVGGAMMIGFAVWEVWNDRNEMMRRKSKGQNYVYEGDHDFWESTITFTIGLVVLAILEGQGIVWLCWR